MPIAQIRENLTAALPHGSLRRRLVGGAIWSTISSIIAQGSSAVASIITARLLGRSIYGELGMVRSTVGLFDAIAVMGLGITANKYVAEFRRSDPAKCGRILGLVFALVLPSAALTALIMAVLAPQL